MFLLMNLLGIWAAVAAAAVFSLGYRDLRKRTLGWRAGVLVAASGLSVPACLMGLHYLHVFPERAWFYGFRSWAGSEFCVLPLAVAAAALASLLPRACLTLPLFGLMSAALVPHLKPLLGPIDDGEFENRWHRGVCQQSTFSTCGPASVATLLKLHGVEVTEKQVARAAHSYEGGTEAWYLARFARRQGLRPRFEFRETFDPEAGLPAVVGVRLGTNGHFIAVLGISDGKVTFADPLIGREVLPVGDFRARYRFTGFHLVIKRRG